MQDDRHQQDSAAVIDLSEVQFRRAVRELVLELTETSKKEAEPDDKVRLVIEVPRAWVSLATWLSHRESHYKRGEWAPRYRVQGRFGIGHEKRWFKNQLHALLEHWFARNIEELAYETHPYLKRAPKSSMPNLDDDIPF